MHTGDTAVLHASIYDHPHTCLLVISCYRCMHALDTATLTGDTAAALAAKQAELEALRRRLHMHEKQVAQQKVGGGGWVLFQSFGASVKESW
eukprot:1157473-Pelagomonas_calceolata.AAC.2